MKKFVRLLVLLCVTIFLSPTHAFAQDALSNISFEDLIKNVDIVETAKGVEISSSVYDLSELTEEQTYLLHRYAIESTEQRNSTPIKDVNLISTENLQLLRRGRPTYKNQYGKKVKKTFGGFAGNQPPGGSKFPTGGGFYFSDSGGPSATLRIAFNAPFGTMSVSVPLGKSSTGGKFVSVPDKTHYFKLYVAKTYDCVPYITWKTDANGHKSIYYRGVSKIFLSDTQWAQRVR